MKKGAVLQTGSFASPARLADAVVILSNFVPFVKSRPCHI